MTNKPMLSVERELLERAASAIEKHHGSLQWVIASELRALLDKQSCGACGGCDNGCKLDRESPTIEPAVQHQGDPVVGHCTHPPGCKFCSWCGFKAEKPAPIPVMRAALGQSQTDLQEGRTVSVEQLRDNLAAKFIGKKP